MDRDLENGTLIRTFGNGGCRHTVSICLILALSTVLVFGATIYFQFTLDDQNHILRNPLVMGDAPISTAFTGPTWPGNLYRPVFLLSLALNSPSSPDAPMMYHLVNVLLHMAAAVVLYLLLQQLCSKEIAALAAILFAVHPIHVGAVANISNRSELLAALFGLLGCYSALALSPARRFAPFCAAVIFSLFICAFFSKESAFCYFLIVPFCFMHRDGLASGLKHSLAALAAMGAAAACYLVFRAFALGGLLGSTAAFEPSLLDNPLISLSFWGRAPIALALLGKYAAMSVVPWPLSSDYSYAKITAEFSHDYLPYAVGCLFLAGLLIHGLLRQKPYWLWPAWFFASYLVTSNILFPTGTAFAERLAYLGSAAISVLLAMSILSFKSKMLRSAATAVVAVLYVGASVHYSLYWYDNYTLAEYEIEQSGKSARVQYNYGIALYTQGLARQSEKHFLRALEIYPQYAEAAYAMGQAVVRRHEKGEAADWYRQTLSLSPNHYGALLGLYGITAGRGEAEKAAAYRKRLLELDPESPRLKRLDHALNIANSK